MDWSDALRLIKRGKAVKRNGWNGKEQWIYFVPAKEFPVVAGSALTNSQPIGTMAAMDSFIAIRVKDGTSRPWLASQADQLSDDWAQVFEDSED